LIGVEILRGVELQGVGDAVLDDLQDTSGDYDRGGGIGVLETAVGVGEVDDIAGLQAGQRAGRQVGVVDFERAADGRAGDGSEGDRSGFGAPVLQVEQAAGVDRDVADISGRRAEIDADDAAAFDDAAIEHASAGDLDIAADGDHRAVDGLAVEHWTEKLTGSCV